MRRSRRNKLISLALSPWSLDLKLFLRACRAREINLRITAEAASAGRAWLFWLLDGCRYRQDKDGAVRLISESSRWTEVLLASGKLNPSGPSLQGDLLVDGGLSINILAEPGIGGCLHLNDETPPLPLIYPEGAGEEYFSLETEESDFSRILPDRVIDEALDFADSW